MLIRSLTVLSLAAVAACAPPQVLRTAFVPDAYLPSRVGAPMDKHEIRASAEIGGAPAGNETVPIDPGWGAVTMAPGIFIPRYHVGGSLYAAAWRDDSNALEVGGQFHYSAYRWARANVSGVPRFPDSMSKDLFWGGTGIRYAHEFESHAFAAAGLQLDLALINEATFVNGRFAGADSESFLLPSLSWQAGYRFTPALSIYGLAGVQRGVRNLGFSDELPRNGDSTMSGYAVANVGGGAEARLGPVIVNVTAAYPLAFDDYVRLSPTVTAQLGFAFGR